MIFPVEYIIIFSIWLLLLLFINSAKKKITTKRFKAIATLENSKFINENLSLINIPRKDKIKLQQNVEIIIALDVLIKVCLVIIVHTLAIAMAPFFEKR